MTTYSWPTGRAFKPATMSFGLKKAVLSSRSPYSGAFLPYELSAGRLMCSVTLPPCAPQDAPARLAFFSRLAGGMHRVSISHFVQPLPQGTMRGSPTLASSVARGATSLALSSAGSFATLLTGDLIYVGQLFIVAADVTATSGGAMTVEVVNRAHGAIAAGTGVVWQQPTADFILPADQVSLVWQPGYSEALALDFEEAW